MNLKLKEKKLKYIPGEHKVQVEEDNSEKEPAVQFEQKVDK